MSCNGLVYWLFAFYAVSTTGTLCSLLHVHVWFCTAPSQTPSLLPPSLLAEILRELSGRFGLRDDAEVSLEADPGTFDAARLAQYRELGVNRLSVGVQSFNEV